MGRAKIYKTADGKRVPSVTTVLKQLGWGKDGLIYWANQQGLEGRTLEEARDIVTGPGTITHAMIEAHNKDEHVSLDGVDREIAQQARRAFANWERWSAGAIQEVVSSESSAVSAVHLFGGTWDMVYRNAADELCMWDAKVASGLYLENALQIAGYGILWDENRAEPIQNYELLRIHRESAAFAWTSIAADSMGHPREAFLLARRLYNLQKEMRPLV